MKKEEPDTCPGCGGTGDVYVDAGCNVYEDQVITRYEDGSSDVICTTCNGEGGR